MTDRQTIVRQTVETDGPVQDEVIDKEYLPGDPDDGDEQVGGALVGGAGGAVVGGIVGGPVGAVVGGAIGAAGGATAGLIDEETDGDEVVVEHEERSQ